MPFMGKKSEPDMAPQPTRPMTSDKPHGAWCATCWGMGDFGKKILYTLVGVLLVYLIFFVGTLMRNNIRKYQFIGQMDQSERMITVMGYGKATGTNDIAVTTIGYTNLDKDVKKAQDDNNKVMKQVLDELKKMGIKDEDLQTDYTIFPEYDYQYNVEAAKTDEKLKGYRVTQSVTVKIRDLSKVSAVLDLAGKYGVNQVSSLSFTVDDQESLKNKAREKALRDVRVKAEKLAQSLNVVLGEVVSYYESPDYNYGYGPAPMMYDGGMAPSAPVAPGSKDAVMNVNVTYKVLGTRY